MSAALFQDLHQPLVDVARLLIEGDADEFDFLAGGKILFVVFPCLDLREGGFGGVAQLELKDKYRLRILDDGVDLPDIGRDLRLDAHPDQSEERIAD